MIHSTEESRNTILAQMQILCKTLPEYSVVRDMNCIGDVLALRIIAEIGDVRRFKKKHALIAYAGIDAPPYPDFIVKMKSGKILLVESKGDDRDNGDSKSKLKLGKTWTSSAGSAYHYFMVFDENPIEGAYTIADFAEMLKDM